MNADNAALLESAAEHLGELLGEVAFVGGATVELWITDPAAPEFRPTADVDVVVEIATLSAFHHFEERLRAQRFEHDQESGVICRFRYPDSDLLLDVMPTESDILGFANRWQKAAFHHAVELDLPSGRMIRVIPPAHLLATKIEAFASRGNNDFYGSRDFQDIVVLVDGREELTGEVTRAPDALRKFIANELKKLAQNDSFVSGIQGALLPELQTQERADLVVKPRIEAMIATEAQPSSNRVGKLR